MIDATLCWWLNTIHRSNMLLTRTMTISVTRTSHLYDLSPKSVINIVVALVKRLKIIPLYVLIEVIYHLFFWEFFWLRIVHSRMRKIELIPIADDSSDKSLSVRIIFSNPTNDRINGTKSKSWVQLYHTVYLGWIPRSRFFSCGDFF